MQKSITPYAAYIKKYFKKFRFFLFSDTDSHRIYTDLFIVFFFEILRVLRVEKLWLALYQSGTGLAWVFESNPGTRYTSGSPSKAVSSQYWAGQMPQEFGSSSSSSYIYSICANYSPAQAQQEVTLIGNPYMYTAREYDIETGLYYYRARYYNPYIGRFLQTDPAYQGMNWYAYCGNNPLNYTDPSGLLNETTIVIPNKCIRSANPGHPNLYEVWDYLHDSSLINYRWYTDWVQCHYKTNSFSEDGEFTYITFEYTGDSCDVGLFWLKDLHDYFCQPAVRYLNDKRFELQAEIIKYNGRIKDYSVLFYITMGSSWIAEQASYLRFTGGGTVCIPVPNYGFVYINVELVARIAQGIDTGFKEPMSRYTYGLALGINKYKQKIRENERKLEEIEAFRLIWGL